MCVIAPSRSLSFVNQEIIPLALAAFDRLGLLVSFGANVRVRDEFDSSPVAARVRDLHTAFQDPSIKAIFTAIGGYNSNQLLDAIDYTVIQQHPKIICGFSDITALTNGIHAKTGLVTFCGPHFSTFGMLHGVDYILEYCHKCLFSKKPYLIESSPVWSDDLWFEDQANRRFERNSGLWSICPPRTDTVGKALGGHIASFVSLHGTDYMPDLTGSVLFLEAHGDINAQSFDRLLRSLTQQPGFLRVRGLCIGRFQRKSNVTAETLTAIVRRNQALAKIPVIANLDFGHTEPMTTFPIGGVVKLEAKGPCIRVLKH